MAITPPSYTASGLASGLNDSQIIQALVSARQAPITALQTEQQGLSSQVSELGTLVSQITALQTAAQNLGTTGAVAAEVTSTNTAFTATAGTQASAGQHTVQVTALASAATARSAGFGSSSAAVTGGQLTLTVQGTQYGPLTITDGESLSDVAQAINGLGAPVSANIVSDGTNSYLQLVNQQTGFPIGSSASSALSVSETDTGTQGKSLGLSVTHQATNAQLTVDDLPMTRTSNVVSDAIPGVTIALANTESAPENLVIASDPATTAQNLQAFVSAYNALNTTLQSQLNVPVVAGTPLPPLATDGSALSLNSQLQSLLTMTVPGISGFNSLAAIGIVSNAQDGSLSIDQNALSAAISSNPAAVNSLFTQATTGIAAAVSTLNTDFADPATGALTQEEQNLQTRISKMTQQETSMQEQVTAYQATLNQQFAAMEQTVAGFKSVGNYLTQLSTVMLSQATGAVG